MENIKKAFSELSLLEQQIASVKKNLLLNKKQQEALEFRLSNLCEELEKKNIECESYIVNKSVKEDELEGKQEDKK